LLRGHDAAGVRPLDRLGDGPIVVRDESENLVTQRGLGGMAPAPEHQPGERPEPDLHLIEPGGVRGQIHEADAMGGSAQEGAAYASG